MVDYTLYNTELFVCMLVCSYGCMSFIPLNFLWLFKFNNT